VISQKVKQFANDNGFDFYVNGLGYRGTAQITTLGDKPQAVSRCNNKSKDALAAINLLIQQKELAAKSNEAIAIEAAEAHTMVEDTTEPAIIATPDHDHDPTDYVRPSYLGFGVEVHCGRDKLGYALAELLDRNDDRRLIDIDFERERAQRMWDRDEMRERVEFPSYSYDLMRL
jgi:hypothetical protein